MLELRPGSCAIRLHLITALLLTVACGDEIFVTPPSDAVSGAGGTSGGTGPPVAGSRPPVAGSGTDKPCVSGEFAGFSSLQVAASFCAGFPLAWENKAEFNCDPIPVPNPALSGIVACMMPGLDVNYLVQWRSTTDARVIQDDAVVATLRNIGPNTFAVQYTDGKRAQCRISGRVLNFCAILD